MLTSLALAAAMHLLEPNAASQALDERLNGILHLLYGVAAALAVLLLAVLAVAIRLYRRSQSAPSDGRVPREPRR